MNTYDLIVIGAGSGGLVAATTANRKGLKTALLEKHKIGGECTHFGCVPSKALINVTKAIHHAKEAGEMGLKVSVEEPDFGLIMEKVDEIVQGIYAHETPDIFEKQGIDVYVDESGAKFLDAHRIQMGDDTLYGKHIIICTGSSPGLPLIEGIEKAAILHNENFWALRKHPGKVVFIGGGVISVELGQALVRLGCDVTIMDRNDRIMKVTDEEVGGYLTKQLVEEGIKLELSAQLKRFLDANTMVFERNGSEYEVLADYFFVAAGRSPNVGGMELEKAGINYTTRKGIEANEFLQTSVPHIYACGDVTTRFKFTHTASHQANICVHNILNGNEKRNDLSVLPWAIFTDPEIGHVGLSVQEAEAKYGKENIQVFKVDGAIDRFITDRNTGGFLKVIFSQNDLVVGAEAIGQQAGEWIQILTIAIKNEIPAAKMADTIFPYPTYAEIVKKAFTRYLRTKS